MTLILDRITCRRSGHTVIRDLSAEIAAGQVTALRGPNGVGKSTLLRTIAGLIPPAAGDATFADLSLTRDRSAFQEQVLYAGHLDAVKPALGFRENLGLWAGLNGTDGPRVDAALAYFGLSFMADRPAGEGSAGQKRRLGLARLMVSDRPLWLLDEPTVSLDTTSVALVADLVRAHAASGGIALVATHADLGLGAIPVVQMTPPETLATPETEPDPFLAGRW